MRMCSSHWSRLRQAIEDRGLSSLVAEDGERAAKNLVSEVQDGPGIDNFDPLMGAHNAIITNALGVAGLALFNKKPDGSEWCPLCFLVEVVKPDHDRNCRDDDCPGSPNYEAWIDFAADGMVEAWKGMQP